MTEPNQATEEDQQQPDLFEGFLVRPEEVDEVWEAEDPQAVVHERIRLSIMKRQYEDDDSIGNPDDRYCVLERRWLTDYYLNNLIFIKSELTGLDNNTVSFMAEGLYRAFDFHKFRLENNSDATNSQALLEARA